MHPDVKKRHHRPGVLERAATKLVVIAFALAIGASATPLSASLYQPPLVVSCAALASGNQLRVVCEPSDGHAVYADKLRLILDGSVASGVEMPKPKTVFDELGSHAVFVDRFELKVSLDRPITPDSKIQLRYRACKLGDYCLPPTILHVPVI